MKQICMNDGWVFRRGFHDSLSMLRNDPGTVVRLPHDGMIGTPVSPSAPARSDMGYFTGGISNYTRSLEIPREWEKECVGLQFDGVMMNATVEVNGCKAGAQHYGYAPFCVDLTDLVTFGAENRITIHVNTSMQPNSRWYTGSGLYRGARLLHGPRVHIEPDGIFARTREVAGEYAFLETETEIRNDTAENRLAEAEILLVREDNGEVAASGKQTVQVNARSRETARIALHVREPLLWDAENPNLYRVRARVTDLGVMRTHFMEAE